MSLSDNPLAQQLDRMLAGLGYNYYDNANRARADDLLVRQRAGGSLGRASTALRTLESAYKERYVPPSTREQPFPPADIIAKLKAVGALRSRIGDAETLIRGMSVPTQDKIWGRFRAEQPLLMSLVGLDYGLVHGAQQIEDAAVALTAADWQARDIPSEFDPLIAELEQAARNRQQFLQMPIPG